MAENQPRTRPVSKNYAMTVLMLRNLGLIALAGVFYSKARYLSIENVAMSLIPLLWMKNPMKYCGCGGKGGCRGCRENEAQQEKQ